MRLTLGETAVAVGGELTGGRGIVTGASTDTRSLQPGDLFFALRVPDSTLDGHAFVADAAAKGAAGAVIGKSVADLPEAFGTIRVDDTLLALGKLGARWRLRMAVRIAAVTGSVGKTSTKGILAGILESAGATLSAERSFNNEMGVPLTLLQLTPQHRYCALELAMRGSGEIDYLARLARPEVGVITNIGVSHVGRLGSRDAIARAKGELLPLLPASGAAVLKRSDFYFAILAEMSAAPVLSFGREADADVRAEAADDLGLEGTSFVCRIPGARIRVKLSVPGPHHVDNALAAAAAAHALGIPPEIIASGLEAYAGAEMRTRVVTTPGGVTVIDDCYNAAPVSVEAALHLLATTTGRKLFVFGGMAELGERADEEHRDVGAKVSEYGVDHLILVGELPALTAETAVAADVKTDRVADADEALVILQETLLPDDTVLVKGSRVAQLERVVEGLVADA